MALNAGAWAAFLAWLAAAGHEPSGPLILPIARADYYLWEALFVVPTHGLMFLVFSGIVFAGTHKTANWGQAQFVAGIAMAAASGLGWLLPDVLVYAAGGFSALGPAMKYYVPLSAVVGVGLAIFGLMRVQGLRLGEAALLGILSWGAHMVVGAPVLR